MESNIVQIIVQSPTDSFHTFLKEQLSDRQIELFQLSSIFEVEQFYDRIRARLVIITVDSEINRFRSAIHTASIIAKTRQSSIILLLSEGVDLPAVTEQLNGDHRIFLLDASGDPQFLLNNLRSLILLDKQLNEQISRNRFEEHFNECLRTIYREDDLKALFIRLVNYFPKVMPFDYLVLFSLDKYQRHIETLAHFSPPTRRGKQIAMVQVEALIAPWAAEDQPLCLRRSDQPALFRQLNEWGWVADELWYFPLVNKQLPVGGLLAGRMHNSELGADSLRFADRLSRVLSHHLYDHHIRGNEAQGISLFSDQLISNHLDEASILQHTCKELSSVTQASSAIFWQHNKGFGFLFPKYSYFNQSRGLAESLDKNLVFLEKEKFLNRLVARGEFKKIDQIASDERLAVSTRNTFARLQYGNVLILPIRLQSEVAGVMILNKTDSNNPFSLWEVHKAEEILKRTQTVLEDAHTVKEANLKLKQLSRIFELGHEIKLDLSLDEILMRIANSVRKTLGWNDVLILLEDETSTNLRLNTRLGFDRTENTSAIDFKGKTPVREFMLFLKQCNQISSSYFYDATSLIPVEEDQTAQLNLTEWNTRDLLIVPLETRNEIPGYLVVGDPVDRLKPTSEKVIPLEYYANQASVAVENTHLYERLKASQERYRSLAETMSMGLLTCNQQQQLVYVNPAVRKLAGYSEEELTGELLARLFTAPSQEGIADVVHELLDPANGENTKIENLEFNMLSAGGESIPVSLFGFPLFEQRVKTGFFLILNDMRIIKRLERMKADFNSMIVHDLRSPMNVIQGFIELIRNKVVGDINEEQEELLDISKENVKKVLTLVDNFLVASKLEVGKFRIDPKLDDINSLIRQQVDSHKILVKNKNIRLNLNLDSNLPLLLFDNLRLEQVVNNLLSNAMKFTPEKGDIFVNTALQKIAENGSEKFYALVSVRDTGIGIPQDKISHIFEKYEQVEEGQSFNVRGTGLGLSICKEIVDLHKGRIWAESNNDVGSTFSFVLPIDLPEDAPC